MNALPLRWELPRAKAVSDQWPDGWPDSWPDGWLDAVAQALPGMESPRWLAQVLWQRQLCSADTLAGWLNPALYRPTPASAFGPAMAIAVTRLQQAIAAEEKVAIWGDFDADGVTATAVLWDGLGQVIPKGDRLTYFIPNRLSESHGLSQRGLDQLAEWGATLLVTCDTGSTSGAEIAYAKTLGMEVIVTDHHTLPEGDIGALALINPRRLPPDHALATLSGVAVAYKLLEGLYEALDVPPPLPLEHVLDLVAIGLIADLVELRGDCRYLAQVGLQRLQTHTQANSPYPRPGLAKLLALCKATGDRPTDISFGLGPRINAVSRIHGDASFCVELLTSQDRDRCHALANEAELANTRRKALQRELYNQVMARVAQVDLATTRCLVLADEQWEPGILGLVAGQVAQALGRPVILLRIDPPSDDGSAHLARGSARSVKGLDLYQLFQAQANLLTGFGGHPLAAGLTLPVEHIDLLGTALNRMVREHLGGDGAPQPAIQIDLTVTVADLGQPLFRELKWLEPCGMGNPVPKLLIGDAWFQNTKHRKLRDRQNKAVSFIKTEFELWDDSAQTGFPGEWWGHYRDELPQGRCDVVVELDFNSYNGYHVKLVDLRPVLPQVSGEVSGTGPSQALPILDWRQATPADQGTALVVDRPPAHWSDWQAWQRQAAQSGRPLALAFPREANERLPVDTWQDLVGIAKYMTRTTISVTRAQLIHRLHLSALSLGLGLTALETAGFEVVAIDAETLAIQSDPDPVTPDPTAVKQFLAALQEEQFRRRYFAQVPVTALVHDANSW